MTRIKGITVTLINERKVGEDEFGADIYEQEETDVGNVLVAPVSTNEVTDALNMYGKKAIYNIAIPKEDTHMWKDGKVKFFGETWKVFGLPKRGISENVPLDWNETWMVERYE